MLVLRVPGSVILVGLAPLGALLATGLVRPRRGSWPAWVFLGIALFSACVSIAIHPAGVPLINSATLAFVFTAFAIAVLCGGAERAVSTAVINALYLTFGFALLVGWFEVFTGIRLRQLLYPDASRGPAVDGPFYVAAWFPNYNDFAVVVTMFAVLALLRFLTDAGSLLVQATRLAGYLSATALILLAGSRGALASLLLGSALVVVQAIRVLRPRVVGGSAVVTAALVAIPLVAYLMGSTWVQDNSTRVRGLIVTQTLAITPDDSFRFWFGWGALESFQKAAASAYPGQLMDPHNLLLEIFTWYGALALVAFIVLWLVVLKRGVWQMDTSMHWSGIGLSILFVLTPFLGVVPSSSLRYYYVFLIAPCAVATLNSRRADGSLTNAE